MLFTITYAGHNTEELGYLLYKNPSRPQTFELTYGKAHVFYTEVSDKRTTAALLLDIGPLDLARGKAGSDSGGLFDYVNDRPYVSSSFMSTAISKVFGTAMTGRADSHQALSDSTLDLTANIVMLPCKGEREMLLRIFEPLGYEVNFETFISDEKFPSWGESKYVNLTIRGKVRLRDLLKHIYVLIPVFDRQKHYWVGADEVEKLLRLGEDWLPNHPEKAYITGRYLNRRRNLVNMAFERLTEVNTVDGEIISSEDISESEPEKKENTENIINSEKSERKISLNSQRLTTVINALKNCGVKSIIDLGCGEGNLLNLLVRESQFSRITGVDVSHTALERASGKLRLDHANERMRERVQLFQSSLTYKDSRFSGYDAACVIEVIEHLDISRLAAFERVLFEFAKPSVVIITTPNKEYNANYKFLYEDNIRHGVRHGDHRFEWTRTEFCEWANKTAGKFGYSVQFSEIGEIDEKYGAPTQMGVFNLL